MDEDAYRSTYDQFNQSRCPFEKAILSRRCLCENAHKFCLAEREGISCEAQECQPRCDKFLRISRKNALFALKITNTDAPLPHAKEIRVQLGSLTGLTQLLDGTVPEVIANANQLLATAETKYPDWHQLPIELIIRSIMHMQGRKRRNKTS